MNKIALVIPADKKYDAIFELAQDNKSTYCAKHSYDLIRFLGASPSKGMSWDKIEYVRENVLPNYEYVLLQGVDTLIMNHNVKIENWIDPNFNWVISKDCHNINADMILIENTKWSFDYLEFIYNQYAQYQTDCWAEQRVIINTYRDHPTHLKVIPQQSFNSYWYPYYNRAETEQGNFIEGDWILHFPGMNQEQRLTEMKKWLEKVVC